LDKIENVEQRWPKAAFESCVKCILAPCYDFPQADFIVLPLLHQKPKRIGPYWQNE
jgi:hypothetical protein